MLAKLMSPATSYLKIIKKVILSKQKYIKNDNSTKPAINGKEKPTHLSIIIPDPALFSQLIYLQKSLFSVAINSSSHLF